MPRFVRGSTPSKRWRRTASSTPSMDGEELAARVITVLRQRLTLLQTLLSGAEDTLSSSILESQVLQRNVPDAPTTASLVHTIILHLTRISQGHSSIKTIPQQERTALEMLCRQLYDTAYSPALEDVSVFPGSDGDVSSSLLALLDLTDAGT